MNILITTGIYPPHIGGPAQYAKNLKEALEKAGHSVPVATYGIERRLPTGIRHLFYFFKILPKVIKADFIIALDMFSVGLPSVLAAKLLRKKIIIRTGGDFLWESYVERTGDLVLLKNFYTTKQNHFNKKDKIIFKLTRWTLRNASALVFSTKWQMDIFMDPYQLQNVPISIIENFYGEKIPDEKPASKIFISGTRPLKWKNTALLKNAFVNAKSLHLDIVLDDVNAPYGLFMDNMKRAYAVVLMSLGDISPNMVMDALRFGKPVIVTQEIGIKDRVKDAVLLVDPQNESAVTNAIVAMCDSNTWSLYKKKAQDFNFVHTWEEVAVEFIKVYKTLA